MKKIIANASCCLLIFAAATTACTDHNPAPDLLQVIDINGQVDGKTYSDLNEVATRWIFPYDIDKSALDDETGARSAASLQPLSTVMILAPNLGGSSTRNLTIPSGRYVYLQIVGNVSFFFDNDPCAPTFKPAPGQSAADFLISQIDPLLDNVQNMAAQFDGKDIVANLKKFKVKTKAFTFIPPKEFTDLACDYTGQTATGLDESFALLLKLPKGKHVLTYKADVPDAGNFHTDLTWNLTVE